MRHGKDTIKQANALIEAMRRVKVPSFDIWAFGLEDRKLIQDMVNKAKRHHSIQERYCSVEMDDKTLKRTEGKELGLERDITEIAKKFGLNVHFDGDPRGYTVKLHAPKNDAWNTWGGSDTGYGIG